MTQPVRGAAPQNAANADVGGQHMANGNTGMVAPSKDQSTSLNCAVAQHQSNGAVVGQQPDDVLVPNQNIGVSAKGHAGVPQPGQARANRQGNKAGKNGQRPKKEATQGSETSNKKRDKRSQRQQQQNRKFQNQIDIGISQYAATNWYLEAVKNGFKNQAALDAFNQIVAERENDIDLMKVPVCMECGGASAKLCHHFITDAGVHQDEGGAIAIPASASYTMRWRFLWVDRVRRMFTWPKFNSGALINHNLNGFDPSQIPDNEVWPELLCYIRLHLMTEYKIDGVFSRKAKLAHCQKLANRFFIENKIKTTDLLTPEMVNKIKLTVARACDQRDDQTLLKECDPRHNFWIAPGKLLKCVTGHRVILIAAIISPVIVAKLVNVSLTMKFYIFGRLVKANAEILGHGSALALRYAFQTSRDTLSALVRHMYSGVVMPCWNQIQQSLWPTVHTMFTRAYTSVISKTHQCLSLRGSICPSSIESFGTSLDAYVAASMIRISHLTQQISLNQRLVSCGAAMFARTASC